ncbi:MAG TPA: acyl-CoA reductase, partial [Anaerolineae bacterium]|nr:acyl-CoA reductase [Anaerolineae bacterium]
MSIVLFTGFPGFLGSELLPRVLGRLPDHQAVCLTQPKFAEAACSALERIADAHP